MPPRQPSRTPALQFSEQGRLKLHFEVNGQVYFLSFIENEGCWYLLAPTSAGVRRIPVYVDAPAFERFGILEAEGNKIQN